MYISNQGNGQQGTAKKEGYVAVRLSAKQAHALQKECVSIVEAGGPESGTAQAMAAAAAERMQALLSKRQLAKFQRYANGQIAVLHVLGCDQPVNDPVPDVLPDRGCLQGDFVTNLLASRSQVILAMVGQDAVSYEFENKGLIARLVGNFLGGGETPIDVPESKVAAGSSSHHGGLLAPHTEGPYFAMRWDVTGPAPSPATLALTGRWNPLAEPTCVVVLRPILNSLGIQLIGLCLSAFRFGVSDSYEGAEAPRQVQVVEYAKDGDFAVRYNDLRLQAEDDAPEIAKGALAALRDKIHSARPRHVALGPSDVLLINNTQAVHARDIVRDNRRLLIRVFGAPAGRPGHYRELPLK